MQPAFEEKRSQDSIQSLQDALEICRQAAKRGHKQAKSSLKESNDALASASKDIQNYIKSLDDSRTRTPELVSQLRGQLVEVANDLDRINREAAYRLAALAKQTSFFSVALFGRTMSGKSTLMEILTNGNGRSIGTGAQRTTRDVRSYQWQGLTITDVPGVAAFEGSDDEEIAFEAAAKADLVLFLITDDAPQPVEAECLARIRRLGKPVLGICNVKAAVDNPEDLAYFIRNHEILFDPRRLGPLVNQFHVFADTYLPGRRISFLYSHLRSRFLANHSKKPEQQKALIAASHFWDVETSVLREVVSRGAFLRYRTFIDHSVAPMMELTERLLSFSASNSTSGRVLLQKKKSLDLWSSQFRTDAIGQTNSFAEKMGERIRREIPDFVENHCEDPRASENWKLVIEDAGIQRKADALRLKLQKDCQESLSEVGRSIGNELSLLDTMITQKQFGMNRIGDVKSAWNWGVAGLSGGLTIASALLASGPLGWAALGVGIIGWVVGSCFDDHEGKARVARERLSAKLEEQVNKLERKLRDRLQDWVDRELRMNQVQTLLNDLDAVINGLFRLSDAQRSLAWALNDRQKKLARIIWDEALACLSTGSIEGINDIARLPGLALMPLIEPACKLPVNTKVALERLMGEHIWLTIDTKSKRSILGQAIGKSLDRSLIRIESSIGVAHVPVDTLLPETRARILLAQQLTSLHVMK